MIVGVPREVKNHEYRVVAAPEGARVSLVLIHREELVADENRALASARLVKG